jgi:hypothetical protein
MGNANCLCSFSKTNVTIEQTGKFKFLVNLPIRKGNCFFSVKRHSGNQAVLWQICYLSHWRQLCATFIDIITKDQRYFLGADSLKVAHRIWHAGLFAECKNPDQRIIFGNISVGG